MRTRQQKSRVWVSGSMEALCEMRHGFSALVKGTRLLEAEVGNLVWRNGRRPSCPTWKMVFRGQLGEAHPEVCSRLACVWVSSVSPEQEPSLMGPSSAQLSRHSTPAAPWLFCYGMYLALSSPGNRGSSYPLSSSAPHL